MIPVNVFTFIFVFTAFTVMFIAIPFFIMGTELKKEDFLYNVFGCLSISSFITVNVVFLLSAIHFLNTFSICVSFLLIIILTYKVFYMKRVRKAIQKIDELWFVNTKGVERGKLIKVVSNSRYIIRDLIKEKSNKLKSFLKDLFSEPIHTVVFLTALGFAVFVRCYHSVTQMTFGSSDIFTHTRWVGQLFNGTIFYDGIYPFGMHNMVGGLVAVFNINIFTAMRFFGCIIGIFTVLSIFLFLTRTFRSGVAAGVGLLIYTATTFIPEDSYVRQAYSLPLEVSIMFILPCIVFLYNYFKSQKFADLLFFLSSLAMIVSCHFYAAIAAGIILGIFCLLNLVRMIKLHIFLKVAAAGFIALAVSLLPMGAALTLGIPWEGSMGWAVDVLKGEDQSWVSGLTEEERLQQEEEKLLALEKMTLWERAVFQLESVRMDNVHTFLISVIGSVLMILNALLLMIFRKRQRQAASLLFAAGGYTLIMILLNLIPFFGYMEIMDSSRIVVFYAMNFAVVTAYITELLTVPFSVSRRLKFVRYAMEVAVVSVIGFLLVKTGVQMPGYAMQSQYNGTVNAYYKILREYPDKEWTAVATVNEIGMVELYGNHYELSDLLYGLAMKYSEWEIEIPSKNVFFFIEKRVLRPNRFISYKGSGLSFAFDLEDPIDTDSAAKNILQIKDELYAPSYIYSQYENRKVVMSKAYYWMEKYKEYFGKNIFTFYEDDDIAVYRLDQNYPYSINNLRIDYEYN